MFDVDRFTSFEGDTGPYILYTIVRIKSILEKYGQQGGSLTGLSILPAQNADEKALMLELSGFQSMIAGAEPENLPPTGSAPTFMICPTPSTVSIMRRRSWRRRMRRGRRV